MDKEGEPLAHTTMITVTGRLDITPLPVNDYTPGRGKIVPRNVIN